MVAIRQDIRTVEEFEGIDFSNYTTNQANTDGNGMGRTPGASYTFGLSTQRHIDVRTFNATATQTVAPSSANEQWTVSGNGTISVGVQTSLNHWLGLVATLTTGTTTITSIARALDLTQLNETNATLTLALPSFPLGSINTASSSLVLGDGTATVSLPLSASTTTLISGNSTATFPLSAITGINLTAVTTIKLVLVATGSCTVNAQALRLIDPNWVVKDVDLDNWNGCLRPCIPLNGAPVAIPNNQVLPQLWLSAAVPGHDDPRPIDSQIAVVFYTGSQAGANSFQVNLRNVNGVDTTQLNLNGVPQVQLNGPQPGLSASTLLGRSVTDLDNQSLSSLDSSTMQNMDAVAATISQSWLAFTVGWGTATQIGITRSWASASDYSWSGSALTFTDGTFQLQNNTYYLATISLTDTVARVQLNQLNQQTFAVGTLLFDTGAVADSYRFIRRQGRLGWKATLQDNDSFVRSVRPESLIFAEYRSAPLVSNTPVQGAHIYTHFAPRVQLWQSWSAVAGGGITPTLVPDTRRSTSGQSTRVDITQPSGAGQGLISNVLTPSDDAISGVVNWSATEIDFDLWFPSTGLNAGASLSLYLLSQDGNQVPLSMPRIIPDQWQSIRAFAPAGLQSGRYQLGITYVGTVAASFWIDSVNVVERTVVWSARANPSDPWTDVRDEIDSDNAGVLLSRGTQLQVRAQALRQDGTIIGTPKIAPIYAPLGRTVWPEDVVADPITLNTATTFTVSGSPTHGQPVTFTNGVTSTPSKMIVNWLWNFGDGATANGPVVQHTYQLHGTYVVTLTIVDAWGTHTPFSQTVSVT